MKPESPNTMRFTDLFQEWHWLQQVGEKRGLNQEDHWRHEALVDELNRRIPSEDFT